MGHDELLWSLLHSISEAPQATLRAITVVAMSRVRAAWQQRPSGHATRCRPGNHFCRFPSLLDKGDKG